MEEKNHEQKRRGKGILWNENAKKEMNIGREEGRRRLELPQLTIVFVSHKAFVWVFFVFSHPCEFCFVAKQKLSWD
jgi:hypothetical protein